MNRKLASLAIALAATLLVACAFDYGDRNGPGVANVPDVVMIDVEYVRVRSADIQARVRAERVERFESRQLMDLHNFYFEQFDRGEVSAFGSAGGASVELDSMDVRMFGGVRLEVESEEIVIETERLEWRDSPRLLIGGSNEETRIFREDGTTIVGVGFRADARRREWEFSGPVAGVYVSEEGDDDDAAEGEEPGLDDFMDDEETAGE